LDSLRGYIGNKISDINIELRETIEKKDLTDEIEQAKKETEELWLDMVSERNQTKT